MKLRARDLRAHVVTEPGAVRPVLIRMAGLWLALAPDEARRLADELHDAADATTRHGQGGQ